MVSVNSYILRLLLLYTVYKIKWLSFSFVVDLLSRVKSISVDHAENIQRPVQKGDKRASD